MLKRIPKQNRKVLRDLTKLSGCVDICDHWIFFFNPSFLSWALGKLLVALPLNLCFHLERGFAVKNPRDQNLVVVQLRKPQFHGPIPSCPVLLKYIKFVHAFISI